MSHEKAQALGSLITRDLLRSVGLVDARARSFVKDTADDLELLEIAREHCQTKHRSSSFLTDNKRKIN
jgi:hypothetical protein